MIKTSKTSDLCASYSVSQYSEKPFSELRNVGPNSIRRAFREKVKRAGKRGRSVLQAWPEILIGTVIKRTKKKHVVEVIRRMTQGCEQAAARLLSASKGGKDLNTAFIERLNGTFRQRMACLTRRCRHAARRLASLSAGMWLVGCTYNFCG